MNPDPLNPPAPPIPKKEDEDEAPWDYDAFMDCDGLDVKSEHTKYYDGVSEATTVQVELNKSYQQRVMKTMSQLDKDPSMATASEIIYLTW